MKVGKFISSLVTGTLAVIALIFCYRIGLDIKNSQGLQQLSYIFTYPAFIIGNIIAFAFVISTLILGISVLFSSSVIMKVLAVIVLIASLLMFSFEAYTLNLVLGIF